MKLCSGESGRFAFDDGGALVDVDVVFVVVDGKEAAVLAYGMGDSEAIAMYVSAATMPPMECPMRITRTDGSTVGEEEPFSTSRSMTLFCSLKSHESIF
jgi:hypothetical protein